MRTPIAIVMALLGAGLAAADTKGQPGDNPPPDMSSGLTRADIQAGMTKARAPLLACNAKPAVTGTVKMKVKVAASGTVTAVEILSTPDKALGTCVVGVMKKIAFAKTSAGGSFSYPVVYKAQAPSDKPPAESPPPSNPPPAPAPSPSNLKESIDRAAISAAMQKVLPSVKLCGAKLKDVRGTVKVTVKVSPDGVAESVELKQTPSPELGACVVAAVKRATFEKTQKGGSFSYPFMF